ncbi:Divalent ion symporter isoform 1 [Hibiscus syriacus]|uniref:Divalent ion symporter isoform 1 n=1 Tax=Hibiscus syriacus TaxID=106335 RepID=A0A6A2X1C9_HIBSY|nr:Divalent ion symporter isoform 1 [Hibiscus syriacus]
MSPFNILKSTFQTRQLRQFCLRHLSGDVSLRQPNIQYLSCLRHPNIVQYYGSEKVDDRLYIYLEYVSGGSIYKLLQEYGQLGEPAIRSYTQQILSGLAYLHSKSTVHRSTHTGRGVKLADFGMAKHIAGRSCPLSFKGSPYWMAPEVAAMFKIGNSKELPTIPDYLSDEGKDFVRQCLQNNPLHRPTAAQLLDHPFVKYAAPLERSTPDPEPSDPAPGVTNAVKALIPVYLALGRYQFTYCLLSHLNGIGQARNYSSLESEQHAPTDHFGLIYTFDRGTDAIPFGYLKQSANLQEGLGSMPKLPNGFYDGQSVLAGRVSRQLLKDHAMMNSSLNISPSSPSPNQASVIMNTVGSAGKCREVRWLVEVTDK